MTTRIGLTSPNYDSSQESKEMEPGCICSDTQDCRSYGIHERGLTNSGITQRYVFMTAHFYLC